jgi:hypothetical protein
MKLTLRYSNAAKSHALIADLKMIPCVNKVYIADKDVVLCDVVVKTTDGELIPDAFSHISVALGPHAGTGATVSESATNARKGEFDELRVERMKEFDGTTVELTGDGEWELVATAVVHTAGIKAEGVNISDNKPPSLGVGRNVILNWVPCASDQVILCEILSKVYGSKISGMTNAQGVVIPFHCTVLQANAQL